MQLPPGVSFRAPRKPAPSDSARGGVVPPLPNASAIKVHLPQALLQPGKSGSPVYVQSERPGQCQFCTKCPSQGRAVGRGSGKKPAGGICCARLACPHMNAAMSQYHGSAPAQISAERRAMTLATQSWPPSARRRAPRSPRQPSLTHKPSSCSQQQCSSTARLPLQLLRHQHPCPGCQPRPQQANAAQQAGRQALQLQPGSRPWQPPAHRHCSSRARSECRSSSTLAGSHPQAQALQIRQQAHHRRHPLLCSTWTGRPGQQRSSSLGRAGTCSTRRPMGL